MKREHAATVERMERDNDRADEAYERSKGDSFMSDLGNQIFDQIKETNRMTSEYLKLGRQQMARDVSAIIGSMAARKGPDQIISEIIALCKAEA